MKNLQKSETMCVFRFFYHRTSVYQRHTQKKQNNKNVFLNRFLFLNISFQKTKIELSSKPHGTASHENRRFLEEEKSLAMQKRFGSNPDLKLFFLSVSDLKIHLQDHIRLFNFYVKKYFKIQKP